MTSVHDFADAVEDDVETVLDILVREGWFHGEDLDELSQETLDLLEAYYSMLSRSSALELLEPLDPLPQDVLSAASAMWAYSGRCWTSTTTPGPLAAQHEILTRSGTRSS